LTPDSFLRGQLHFVQALLPDCWPSWPAM